VKDGLELIKDGRCWEVLFKGTVLHKIHEDYDGGWAHTYAKRTMTYYEEHPEELLRFYEDILAGEKKTIVLG
jgi:hypothetical protein